MAKLSSPNDLAEATWAQIRPFYQQLLERHVDGAWLRDWSRLEDLIAEAGNLAHAHYYADTKDPALKAAELRFTAEIKPAAADMAARLSRQLLDSGYSEPDFENVLNQMRNQAGILVAENVPLLAEDAKLSETWAATLGAMTSRWDGRDVPRMSLFNHQRSPDRVIRERAWLAMAEAVTARYEELDLLFASLVDVRDRIARNAGCDSYAEYGRRMRNRIDFTLNQTDRMYESVLDAWLPLLAGLRAREASRLGVERLRPWDSMAPISATELRPYESTDELTTTFERVFSGLHPGLGEHFTGMRRDGLLDLGFRPNAAPAAMSSRLHFTRRSQIFMGFPPGDMAVMVLAHESGHSFHFLESARYPLHWHRLYNAMAAEFASTTMQLLVIDRMARGLGGFYSDEDARHSAVARLRQAVVFPVRQALDHAFERWAYDHPTAASAERTAAWRRIWGRQAEGEDWTGLQEHFDAARCALGTLYTFPFYDFDYVVGWLGALQVYRNFLHDPKGTVDAYLDALRLGNTKTVPEIYATAGARIDLDPNSMRELAGFVAERLEQLESP
jgi:oligoendopeptidase F